MSPPLIILFMIITFFLARPSFAAHPLITDDTQTQGKGKKQLEINGQIDSDQENSLKTEKTQIGLILSYGLTDQLDLLLGIPYQIMRTKENTAIFMENGWGDVSWEVKWRFYQGEKFSLALKPGLTLPLGNEEKGFGSGEITFRLFFIATMGKDPWAMHLNLGYIRHENKIMERKDLWHISLAPTVQVGKDLKLVANVGVETNPEIDSHTHPAFALGGFIYSLTENFDIDLGWKIGLNKPEIDYSLLVGMAWRF